MNGLTIKDILMSENKLFTHDEVYMVGGEYYKSKETNEWISETEIDKWEIERLNIEIQQYNETQQDKYY